MFDIDFVVLWVDGTDVNWQKEFNKYLPEGKESLDIGSNKYRDNGLLKYWFRGVDKFAPWVRKIHFVTMGQKPEWLDTSNPKIHLVNHSDYIDAEYLPLFNSSAIELCLHKIPDLSEHFVYFNDDFFLINKVSPSDYFTEDGFPKDSAVFRSIPISTYGKILLNNETVIDKYIDRKAAFSQNKKKWFTTKYKRRLLNNIFYKNKIDDAYLECCHYSRPLTKQCFIEGWNLFENDLVLTMKNRYRTNNDISFCVFRILNLYKGNFEPINNETNKLLCEINKDIDKICSAIKKQTVREIVINDSLVNDYDEKILKIQKAFDSILPEKSGFEK